MDYERSIRSWIQQVVIDQNFCPFAAKEFLNERIAYRCELSSDPETQLKLVSACFEEMNADENIETALLIYPHGLEDFEDFLDRLDVAQLILEESDLEGVYQLASFHPAYLFGDAEADDPSNFTNRSPWPMIHIIREDSLEEALEHYPDPENIPLRNIAKARELGTGWFTALLANLRNHKA